MTDPFITNALDSTNEKSSRTQSSNERTEHSKTNRLSQTDKMVASAELLEEEGTGGGADDDDDAALGIGMLAESMDGRGFNAEYDLGKSGIFLPGAGSMEEEVDEEEGNEDDGNLLFNPAVLRRPAAFKPSITTPTMFMIPGANDNTIAVSASGTITNDGLSPRIHIC